MFCIRKSEVKNNQIYSIEKLLLNKCKPHAEFDICIRGMNKK